MVLTFLLLYLSTMFLFMYMTSECIRVSIDTKFQRIEDNKMWADFEKENDERVARLINTLEKILPVCQSHIENLENLQRIIKN